MIDAQTRAAGVRAFFKIAERWRLTESEQMRILGLEQHSEFEMLKLGIDQKQREETLIRISYILGIFKAINTLLPIPEQADSWLRATNAAPIFSGMAAIDLITTGYIADLQAVRRYLDSQLI